jgi:membrane-associated phospholipid phosphatase
LQHATRLTLILAIAALGASGTALGQTRADQTPTPTPAPSDVAVPAPMPETNAPAPPAANPEPEPNPPPPQPGEQSTPSGGLASDMKLYFTAPLRWRGAEWAWFGGALLAIGATHHYDTQVRTHFVKDLTPTEIANKNTEDLPDALPAVGVVLLTWGYAWWVDDSNGRRETWAMLEAAGLSTVSAYALKFAVRREGPDQTSDPNMWGAAGGRSFPSEHATASFAIGTVLAESGSDEYRWLRRLLGYGLGVGTSYLRLKHNAHWLSDTVAGAALGISTAHFTMNHTYQSATGGGLSVVPVPGGAMLTYRTSLP